MYVWKPYANEVRFSVHQLCMISIHRLDKLLGPSSMNLERNWSQCKIRSLLMLKGRKPGEVLWCVFDTISTRFNNIDSPGDWNWVEWPDSFEELWSLPPNGHRPYTFFVGSIHNVGHSYRTSGVRWFQFTWFQRVHPLPVFKRKKSFALISTSTISGWQSRTLHWINHRSYCGISDSATCSQISCFIENSIQGPVIWTGDDECTACDIVNSTIYNGDWADVIPMSELGLCKAFCSSCWLMRFSLIRHC